jgi:hypothetical protein
MEGRIIMIGHGDGRTDEASSSLLSTVLDPRSTLGTAMTASGVLPVVHGDNDGKFDGPSVQLMGGQTDL